MRFFDDVSFGKLWPWPKRGGESRRGARRKPRRLRSRLERLESRDLLTTFTVTNTADSGDGSLRQAILDVNADTGETSDVIAFDIGGGGVQTIQPLSPLPTITNPVTIDGETQPSYAGSPLIVLDGSQAGTGPSAIGLNLHGGDSVVRGLVVNQFNGAGIGCYIDPGDTIQGCYIGTDVTGTIAEGNGNGIIFAYGAGGLVGGTDPSQRDIISGNGYGVLPQDATVIIEGNYIGTDVTGQQALPNDTGVYLQYGGASVVGGNLPGSGNLISGNGGGVRLGSAGANVVEGNLIGTDHTGVAAIPNGTGVYFADGASGDTLGGTTPAARNVISGNSGYGVYLNGAGVTDNVVEGNYIGTDVTGTAPLGNGGNVLIEGGSNNTIGGTAPGAANIIAYGTYPFEGGVNIFSATAPFPTGDSVRGNSIFGNAGIGIDVSFSNGGGDGVTPNEQGTMPGPNNLQNYPVLATATSVAGGTQVSGTLTSTPNTTFAVDVYADDTADPSAHGQGQYYLGAITVTTDAGGNASFSATLPQALKIGEYISATATDPNGNTSEFSEDVPVYNPGEVPAIGTLYVLNTNDSGYGSLRQAILDANAMPGTHTIAFDIGGGGLETIQPLSPLPTITNPVIIDGWTQPGFAGFPLIVLDGSKAGNVSNGLGQGTNGIALEGDNSIARGLVVNQFAGPAILLLSQNDTVEGSYIGTDPTGTISKPNGGGILSYYASGTIGGTDPAQRNIISGNGSYGINPQHSVLTIEGNYIGTDVTGTHALSNGIGVFLQYSGTNLVGGTAPGAGNLISGNSNTGVYLAGTGVTSTVIEGNYIGTDVRGLSPVANGTGIVIGSSGDNTVGGTAAAARNLISGNVYDGVLITGSASTGNVIEGNYIGTNAAGTAALANDGSGVDILGAHNTVGGDTAAARNVISGNLAAGVAITGTGATGNIVEGDYIGTDNSGTKAVGNNWLDVLLASGAAGNLIGTNGDGESDDAERNIIDGGGTGVYITGGGTNNNIIAGNYIGTDTSGTRPLGNVYSGVLIDAGAQGNLIGTDGASVDNAGERNVISGNGGNGVDISGASSDDNIVAGNYIGVDGTGTKALPNGGNGVVFVGGSGNVVGGATTAARNVVSGNNGNGVQFSGDSGDLAEGDYIGTDVSGTAAIPNQSQGVLVSDAATGNTISGSVISGNVGNGIVIGYDTADTGNTVAGNRIGTNASGTAAITNGGSGVWIIGTNNLVGGVTAAARNVISGNHWGGVSLSGNGNTVEGNFLGTDATGTAAIGNGSGVSIAGSNNIIGGGTTGAGNLISGDFGGGIAISGATAFGNVVEGNYVGVDITGSQALGDGWVGILLNAGATNNLIGSNGDDMNDAGERNLVSDNGTGIYIDGPGTNDNTVAGNYIGTDASGQSAIGNQWNGILIDGGAQGNVIGTDGHSPDNAAERNVISGNDTLGIAITGTSTDSNVVAGNYIGVDASGEHALGNGWDAGVDINSGAQDNLVGTDGHSLDDAAERNVISGNGTGVYIHDVSTNDNTVAGNYIGTDATGTQAIPNGWAGVFFDAGAANNLVGISGGGNVDQRNLISGNGNVGVAISASTGNQISGNYIGTDSTGTQALGNPFGVLVYNGANGNIVGANPADAQPAEGNVISGNAEYGISLYNAVTGSIVDGNFIGVDASRTKPLGNGLDGLVISDGSSGNTIGGMAAGAANVIADSGGAGVSVWDTSQRNSIRGNSIFANGALGIDLGNDGVTQNMQGSAPGPNNWQNYPVLASAYEVPGGAQVTGTLTSAPNATFAVDFYSNDAADPSGHGQGQNFVGSINVTTDANGNASFSTIVTGLQLGQFLSATATDASGDTSEFALDVPVDIATSTSISSDHPAGSVYGQSVTLTASVAAKNVAGDPTGSIQFVVDGANYGSPEILTDGAATLLISTLNAGPHTFTAVYISDDADYASSATPAALDEAVSPAQLTITANNQSMVYGGPLPALTASYSGFVNGDTSASLMTQPTFSTTATAASHANANPYLITAAGAVDSDYSISYVAGGLTVTPAPLTITAHNQTMVYGGALPALTVTYSGLVNGDTPATFGSSPNAAPTVCAPATNHVGSFAGAIALSGAVDPDYTISYVPGTLTVTPAALTITANNQMMVYGGPLPALTASYSGFVNGDTTANLSKQPTFSTTATTSSPVSGSPYAITAAGAADADYNISYLAGKLTVTPATLTVTANNSSRLAGTANPTFTDTITGFVNGDPSSVVNGTASLTTAATPANPVGTYLIVAAQGTLSAANYQFTFVNGTLTVTVANSVYLLNPSASGALTVTGNASLNLPGVVVVDSNSKTALVATANAQVKATGIDITGGASSSGDASISPQPLSGRPAVPDPLSSLATPTVMPSSPVPSSVSLSGNSSLTINPGVYTQITVSGNATLTMTAGTYVIAGGGFAVSGNASVTGSNVTIYNAGSNYLGNGSKYGGVDLSGNGQIELTAPASGPYAGIVIFQSRDNTQPLSLSGNAMDGIAGTIYAANAAASISGNASLDLSLVVSTLTLSGNAVLNDVPSVQPSTIAATPETAIPSTSGSDTDNNALASASVGAKDAFFTSLGS